MMTKMKGHVPLCAVVAALVAVTCLGFVPSPAEAVAPDTSKWKVLTSDADVSALASEIGADGVLEGYEKVQIEGNVTDLSPLSALKRIKNGRLFIRRTTALTDLTGLENLETVDLDFNLDDNKKLESIALDSLATVVDWSLRIRGNEKLESIALNSLANVNGSLSIIMNEMLESVSLPKLSSVGDDVGIKGNPLLPTLSLPVLSSAAYVGIRGNRLLSTLSLNISSVGESVYIEGNGLEALGETVHFGSVEESFYVDEKNLTSVDVFAVDSVGTYMTLEGGPKLTSLEGMQIGSVGKTFDIIGEGLSADSVPTDLVGIAGMGVTVNGESIGNSVD